MASLSLPPCPPNLKSLQHYIKLASDYEARNPAITYWARLHTLQSALKIDRQSPEAKQLLMVLMDWLEKFKKEHTENEAITNDVAGQAVLENEAHKLFTKADADDRASNFNKNLVKMFYTCGIILDVCETFGELSSEVAMQRKYAKWKATYIHNCLKNGETPIPGPLGGEDDDEGIDFEFKPPTHQDQGAPSSSPAGAASLPPTASVSAHVPTQEYGYVSQPEPAVAPAEPEVSGQQIALAQKFCKYAMSALDYEDIGTAVANLEKALATLMER